MSKELIEEFLYEESKNPESWFKGINALYCKTNEEENKNTSKFSDETLKWIFKQSKLLGTELLFFNNLEMQEAQLELNALNEITNPQDFDYDNKFSSWRNLVSYINEARNSYIEQIKGSKLDYIVISEAPMLNYKLGKFFCNYLFGAKRNGGSYRKVPYEAFGGEEDPDGNDLIEIFNEKKVGFFDLIPIPLPKIDSELRRLWSQDPDFKIDKLPRTMFFLKLAFEKFMESSSCTITNETKVILMMPPNTAMGIISFYLDKGVTGNKILDDLSNKFIIENNNSSVSDNKELGGVPVRLHRQIVMNGSGGPDLKLFKHALNES
jgi:hypothetical protein